MTSEEQKDVVGSLFFVQELSASDVRQANNQLYKTNIEDIDVIKRKLESVDVFPKGYKERERKNLLKRSSSFDHRCLLLGPLLEASEQVKQLNQ